MLEELGLTVGLDEVGLDDVVLVNGESVGALMTGLFDCELVGALVLEELGLTVGLDEVGLILGDSVFKTNGPATTLTGSAVTSANAPQSPTHSFACSSKVEPKLPSSIAILITSLMNVAGGFFSNSSAFAAQPSTPHNTLISICWTYVIKGPSLVHSTVFTLATSWAGSDSKAVSMIANVVASNASITASDAQLNS